MTVHPEAVLSRFYRTSKKILQRAKVFSSSADTESTGCVNHAPLGQAMMDKLSGIGSASAF